VKGVDPQEIRRETRIQIVVLRGVGEDRHFGAGKTFKNYSVGELGGEGLMKFAIHGLAMIAWKETSLCQ
jgi:hypothetical protein